MIILKQIDGKERPLQPKDLLVLNEDGSVRLFKTQDEVDSFWEWSKQNEPFLWEESISIWFDDE